jgi:iron complex outermembrane receptor protein
MRHRWSGVEIARTASIGLGLITSGLLAPAAGAQDAASPALEADSYAWAPHVRVQRAEDLSRLLPALEIHSSFLSDPNLYIRGIGQQHWYDNFTAPVAVYSDGVYANRSAGQWFEAFDLARAEVRRGPQGSVYARNATAGAVLLQSRLPDGEFSGDLTADFGNYRALELDGAVGFPILGERLSARIAGTAHFRDGFTRNACRNTTPYAQGTNEKPECDINGDDYAATRRFNLFPVGVMGDFEGLEKWTNDVHDWAGRGLLRFRPNDAQDWLLKVHGERNRGDSRHLQMMGVVGHTGVNAVSFSEDTEPRYDHDPFVGWYDQEGDDTLDRWGASVTGEIDLGDARFTSILAYWQRNRLVQDEGDATPDVLLATDWSDKTRQGSVELRADGGGEDHSWTTGIEFLYESFQSENVFKSHTLDYVTQSSDETLLSFAPYVQGLWQFAAHWSAELGARFTWEQREIEFQTWIRPWERVEAAPGRFAAGWQSCCAQVPIGVLDPTDLQRLTGPELREDARWAAPTGEFALHYAPWDDVRLYARYTRGRKGGQTYGGFEAVGGFFGGSETSILTANPEFVHAGEVGLHSVWFDGALGFEASLFYADYQDMQVFDFANELYLPPMNRLLNADARALGVDADFTFQPLPRLTAQIGFGWLDAEYVDFQGARRRYVPPFARGGSDPYYFTPDYSGNPLVGAPRYRFSGRIDYRLSIGRLGSLLPSFAFRYRSKTYLDVEEKEELSQGAYWVLDARLAWLALGERLELAGWVRNLTDEHYLTDAFDQTIYPKQILYVYADPRLFGGSVSVRW